MDGVHLRLNSYSGFCVFSHPLVTLKVDQRLIDAIIDYAKKAFALIMAIVFPRAMMLGFALGYSDPALMQKNAMQSIEGIKKQLTTEQMAGIALVSLALSSYWTGVAITLAFGISTGIYLRHQAIEDTKKWFGPFRAPSTPALIAP